MSTNQHIPIIRFWVKPFFKKGQTKKEGCARNIQASGARDVQASGARDTSLALSSFGVKPFF